MKEKVYKSSEIEFDEVSNQLIEIFSTEKLEFRISSCGDNITLESDIGKISLPYYAALQVISNFKKLKEELFSIKETIENG